MATLDYALLAEYARVDASGLITIVGAGFDRVQAPGPHAAQQVFVAMRILLGEHEPPAAVDVRVSPPGAEYELTLSGLADRNPSAEPFDGRFGVTMAMGFLVPLPSSGRYVVRVTVQGEPSPRDLPFLVTVGQS